MTDAILAYERKEEDDFYALLGCDELSSVSTASLFLQLS